MKNKKKLLIKNVSLSIIYLLLLGLDICLLHKREITNDNILLISLSVVLFLIPFLSLFFPRRVYHLFYRAGVLVFQKSEVIQKYEGDSYKKFHKICFGLLIAAELFILLSIVLVFA